MIVLFGFLLRFYRIGEYPPLLWDEAALGYNAYSLLQTGRDEHGAFLPLVFKSFCDYKPGLYIYLSLPFVLLSGLNEISIRLASILAGSLSPLFLYLLITKLDQKKQKVALFSSLILAVTPLSIHFSRGAWESNLLVFEILLGLYLYFSKKFLLSALIFSISLYTYQSAKLLLLLILLPLRPPITKFLLPIFLFSIPLIYGLVFSPDSNRLKVVSLFSYPQTQAEVKTIIDETNTLDYLIFHHQYLNFARQFLMRFFNHFSPRFLFLEGDWQSPRHSAPYTGVLLLPSLFFLILGFSQFTVYRSLITKLFLYWLFIAPIPASLTRDLLSAVRSLFLVIPLTYFTALGLSQIISRRFLSLISYLLFLVSFIYYSDLYYNHMVKKSPFDFLYGNKEVAQYVIKNQDKYDQIYYSNFYGQPHIFYLFYSRYSPQKYQEKNHLSLSGPDTGSVKQIDNIFFTSPDFNFVKNRPYKTLAIFSFDEVARQGIDKKLLTPISTIGGITTYYAYSN